MADDNWHQAKLLFEQALSQPVEQRLNFISSACNDDKALYQTVCSMLEAQSDVDDLGLSQLVAEQTSDVVSSLFELEIGSLIGHFQVTGKIAEGGMGSVYLGKRADNSYEQNVAIKLLHARLFSNQAIERFQRERQILADLDHQNIARLLDGGTTNQGIPFLVMEYIDGKPLTTCIENDEQNFQQLLSIFLQVCDAVEYAHQNLVIHQDIKAENIMVTAEGRVKLLDFGIATIDDNDESLDKQKTTQAMTPESASPEQVAKQNITTSTDIYSLGVLLFKLLTGKSPYQGHFKNIETLSRAIQTLRPKLMSEVVESAKVKSLLKGDLDAIAQMALEKEPARRYPSASALADDIRNYFRKLPVKARPQTPIYQISKLATRFPKTLSFGGAAFVAFVATVLFYTFEVSKQRDLAQQRLQTAQQVSDFLVDVFSISDPIESLGNRVTARQVLDQGATRIEATLSNQPDIQHELNHTIGRVYLSLGIVSQAQAILSKEQNYREQRVTEDPQALVRNYKELAKLYFLRGEYNQYDAILQKALQIQHEMTGPDSLEIAEILLAMSKSAEERGHLQQARSLHDKGLSIQRQHLKEDSKQIIDTLIAQNLLLASEGNYTGAIQGAQRVHQLILKTYGELHPVTAQSYSDWGYFVDQIGEFETAKDLLLRALEIDRQIYPESHPVIAGDLLDLGSTMSFIDEQQGIDYLQQVIDMGRESMGEIHPAIGIAHNDLAAIYAQQKQVKESEFHYLEALRINNQIFDEVNPEIATNHSNLGVLYLRNGRLAESEYHLFKAKALREQLFGGAHPHLAASLSVIGSFYFDSKKFPDALDYFQQSLEMKRQFYPDTTSMIITARARVVKTLMTLNDYEKAHAILNIMHKDVQNNKHATAFENGYVAKTFKDFLMRLNDCDRVVSNYTNWQKTIVLANPDELLELEQHLSSCKTSNVVS